MNLFESLEPRQLLSVSLPTQAADIVAPLAETAVMARKAAITYFKVGSRFRLSNSYRETTMNIKGSVSAVLQITKSLGAGKFAARYSEPSTGKVCTLTITLGTRGRFTYTEKGINETGKGSGTFSADGKKFTATGTWASISSNPRLKGTSTFVATRM